MAAAGGGDHVRNHLDGQESEERSFFGRVKDSLNFTKHLGFVSDLDSPANQAALAASRDREEREGVTEVVPETPLSDRLMEGINSVAGTAVEVTSGMSGGVAPRMESSQQEAESSEEQAQLGGTGDRPEMESVACNEQQEDSQAPVSKKSEHHKWAHWQGHKEKEPEAKKDDGSFAEWAFHTAKKLGNVVASKDLSDDLLPKKPK